MKLTKSYWIALGIMLFLFVLPTLMTWGAPAHDGTRVYGFPLPFYSEGGFCLPPGCNHDFYPSNLFIDLLLVVLIPLVVTFIIQKIKK